MNDKLLLWSKRIGCLLFVILLSIVGIYLVLCTPKQYSDSERRTLAKDKAFSIEAFMDGKYMRKFEDYSLDQFPLRDSFRTIKSISERYLLGKKDSNQIYYVDGYLSKIDYPINDVLVNRSSGRINEVYDTYLKEIGIKPYLVVVPDKNYYLAPKDETLQMNYDDLYERFLKQLSFANYIEIKDLLSIENYYYTDTHWRQDTIQPVANRIAAKMGVDISVSYDTNTLDFPFNGVYVGQAALPVKPDSIQYLTNNMLNNCTVVNYDTGMPVDSSMYDFTKGTGKDPYEFFLSGSSALITIENPDASSNNELVIFRDSFGSSLVPLLVPGYKKITLVDVRYIRLEAIGAFIEFSNQDVLFEYSTLMINQGLGGSLQ